MKKPKYPYRIAIIMFLLTVPPIGATQLGWYLHDMQTGFDYGMIVGTVSVIYAAWLMYEKNWRDEDEDQQMEKIIFFGLIIPILIFIVYLGGRATMTGFSAKNSNRLEQEIEKNNNSENLSEKLDKLNELLKSGALTQEEFEKAKKKILDN